MPGAPAPAQCRVSLAKLDSAASPRGPCTRCASRSAALGGSSGEWLTLGWVSAAILRAHGPGHALPLCSARSEAPAPAPSRLLACGLREVHGRAWAASAGERAGGSLSVHPRAPNQGENEQSRDLASIKCRATPPAPALAVSACRANPWLFELFFGSLLHGPLRRGQGHQQWPPVTPASPSCALHPLSAPKASLQLPTLTVAWRWGTTQTATPLGVLTCICRMDRLMDGGMDG